MKATVDEFNGHFKDLNNLQKNIIARIRRENNSRESGKVWSAPMTESRNVEPAKKGIRDRHTIHSMDPKIKILK